MSTDRPNILFILTDQQRRDSIGAYGAALAQTPVLDGLAEQGSTLEQAYTPCTVCSPARASVFSGLYPHQHSVIRNGADFRRDIPNLASSLLDTGYRLGYTGKWHIDEVYGPTHFGFRANDWLGYSHPAGGIYLRSFRNSCKYPVNHYLEYLNANGLDVPELEEAVYYPVNPNFEIYGRQTGPVEASFEHYVAEEAIDLVTQLAEAGNRDDRPFFVWANFWGPHDPFILPEPYFSLFSGDDVELSPSMQESWENKPWVQKRMSTHFWGIEDMEEATWREAVAKYAAYCALLDWETGRIVERLEALGVLDNTIIVYTADHGSMVGHHKLIDKGPYPYDGIQRIPMIVRGPGVQSGQRRAEFVYLHDLTPTILDWAGAERFPTSNAQSLVPVLAGGALPESRDDVYMARHHHPMPYEQRFVRTRRHKYAYNAVDVDELYDLAQDPDEMVNRIDDPAYADVKEEMRARMWEHMQELRDPIRGGFNTFGAARRF
ncbi:MAG: sulfatase-like hydrolase/transferase [Anaerolineae bacterium]